MSDIRIEEYAPKYRKKCIDLLSKTFKASDEKAFQFRFENRSLEPLIIIALDGEDVVSFNSWIPWKFRYNKTEIIGYQSGESATDKNYRRRGIFSNILKYADQIADNKNIDFFFGYPSEMSYGILYRLGYRPLSNMYFSLKLISPFLKNEKMIEVNSITNEYLVEDIKITPVLDQEYFKWRY